MKANTYLLPLVVSFFFGISCYESRDQVLLQKNKFFFLVKCIYIIYLMLLLFTDFLPSRNDKAETNS